MFTNEQIKQFVEQKYSNIKLDIKLYKPMSFAAKLEQIKLDIQDQILQMLSAVNTLEKMSKYSGQVKLGFQLAAQHEKSTQTLFSVSIIVDYGTSSNEYQALFDADTGFLKVEKVTPIEHPITQSKEIKISEKSPLKVLIADDNKAVRITQVKFVKAIFNITPTLAKDGKEAYEAAENNEFDILLLDNQMPEIFGIKVAETIKKRTDAASHSAMIFLFTADNLIKPDFIDKIYQKPLMKSYIEDVKKLYEEKLQTEQSNVTTVAENKNSTEAQTPGDTEEKIEETFPSSSQSP